MLYNFEICEKSKKVEESKENQRNWSIPSKGKFARIIYIAPSNCF